MRIASSNIELASEQINYKNTSVYERLHKWDKKSDITSEKNTEAGILRSESMLRKDILNLSENAKQANAQAAAAAAASGPQVQSTDQTNDELDKLFGDQVDNLKMQIVKDMVEMFTGKKMQVFDSRQLHQIQASTEQLDMPAAANNGNVQSPEQTGPKREGWGIDYFRREVQQSKEGFTFTAQGSVKTADGKEINFSASLEMSRESYKETTTSIKDGDALIDPLVVNFTGAGTQLSDVKFQFDLDADGKNESINAPSAGSGLLAYDQNGNGIIDNGTELFGPSSGNGFLELSAFDDDKNGWIDENDAVFTKLKVWEKGTDGTDVISGLLAKDIGAIYTGSVDTKYALYNNNTQSGQIRESGLWIKESNGSVGTIQEIDLVA